MNALIEKIKMMRKEGLPLPEVTMENLIEFSQTVDTIIALEKDEQRCILDRETKKLPDICAKINQSVSKLYNQQDSLTFVFAEDGQKGSEFSKIAADCRVKMKWLNELTAQNHLLLENNVRFLEDLFIQIVGQKEQTNAYNQFGSRQRAVGEGGNLLNAEV
jgi:hypothetical protein